MIQPALLNVSLTHQILSSLKTLRREIHHNPELAGQEIATAHRIQNFISLYNPDEIITNIGKTGLAAVYCGAKPGPTVVIRGDMDAVPIHEVNTFSYCSKENNVSHMCGHDGHVTIVSGLAPLLYQNPIQRGKVILLFQPAEETGEGAAWIVESEKFKKLEVDYIFGLHNLPQYPFSQVLVKTDTFAAASKGMIIKLKGATSHAAHPEDGRSPVLAMASIVAELTKLPSRNSLFRDFVLVTVVHARVGDIAFGTTPGEAEVMATLRSYQNADMEVLTETAISLAEKAAQEAGLDVEISWTEEFPATVNHTEAVEMVKKAAINCNYNIVEIEKPFRWSEDFGHYTLKYKGAYFGLGAGEKYPQLHNCNYDFPDELIQHGVKIFSTIIYNLLGSQQGTF